MISHPQVDLISHPQEDLLLGLSYNLDVIPDKVR